MYNIASGATTPTARQTVWFHSREILEEPGGGIGGWNAVQQHRKTVRRQDQIISIVPLPSGGGVHPCRLEGVVVFVAALEDGINSNRSNRIPTRNIIQ
jgi:hypothetical protein